MDAVSVDCVYNKMRNWVLFEQKIEHSSLDVRFIFRQRHIRDVALIMLSWKFGKTNAKLINVECATDIVFLVST